MGLTTQQIEVRPEDIFESELGDAIQPQGPRSTVIDRRPQGDVQDVFETSELGTPIKPEVNVSAPPQFVGNVVSNFFPSLLNVAKSYVEPFMDLPQTYENMKSVWNGFAELKERDRIIAENPNAEKPPITDNMRSAMAVSEYFAERYGDVVGPEKDAWDVVGKKILRTIENDPAGFLADLSGIVTMGGGAINLVGKTGKVSSLTRGVGETVSNVGKNISAAGTKIEPVSGTIRATGQYVGAPIVNTLSGEGTASALSDSFNFGEIGGKINKEFRKGLKGKLNESDILKDFNARVKTYKDNMSTNFNDFKQRIKGQQPIDSPFESLNKLEQEVNALRGTIYETKRVQTGQKPSKILDADGKPVSYEPTFETQTKIKPNVNSNKLKDFEEIETIFNRYKQYGNDITADNIYNMKVELQDLRTAGNKNVDPLKRINKTIINDLEKVDPYAPDVMDAYSKFKKDLDKIQKVTGKGDNQQTQITKILQLGKDTPRGRVGTKTLDDILADLDSSIIPQIKGSQLNRPFNVRGAGTAAGGIGASLLLDQYLPLQIDPMLGGTIVAGTTAASSPRFMGNLANRLGQASSVGINLQNFVDAGRFATRPTQQSLLEPFPVTNPQQIDYQIDPSLFDIPL